MLSLFFPYYFSLTILNALLCFRTFGYIYRNLCEYNYWSRAAPLERSFGIENCLDGMRMMKENSI